MIKSNIKNDNNLVNECILSVSLVYHLISVSTKKQFP